MTHIDMHDAIDRLDTGLPQQPELAGIIAGGRRRRRRTRTVWAAAGLATVAGVAQVAYLAGTQHAASPAPAAASSVDPTDALTQVDSAVVETFPDAQAEPASPATLPPSTYAVGYQVEGLLRLGVASQRASALAVSFPACGEGSDGWPQGCTETRVGDFEVAVMQVQDKAEPNWSRTVYVRPADPTTGETWMVMVTAFVDSATWAEAEAALPSVETLTDLALDERLVAPAQ